MNYEYTAISKSRKDYAPQKISGHINCRTIIKLTFPIVALSLPNHSFSPKKEEVDILNLVLN